MAITEDLVGDVDVAGAGALRLTSDLVLQLSNPCLRPVLRTNSMSPRLNLHCLPVGHPYIIPANQTDKQV
jgi:hypothetical protein